MPSFLRDFSIRRKSKASIRTNGNGASEEAFRDSSGNNSSIDGDGPDRPRPNKSSSTLSSWLDKSSPPTTISEKSKSNTNLAGLNGNGKDAPPVPNNSRPRMASSQSNRYSLIGGPRQNSDNQQRPTPSTSPYAPRVVSVSDGSWVHQKVLLIFGIAADASQPVDGTLTVNHHQDNFPATQWPVCDSHFKALVHLQPGPNKLRLDFVSPKVSNPNGQAQPHSSWININFLPLIAAPPLQLCILVAKDSPETYDAVPDRVQREGNGLAQAVKKFRMAAYLWQAFTAEQMNRNGFGRRVYRYEEEWQPGTLSWKDAESGQMRNEAKIHIIRLKQTVKEIQDLNIAQQNEQAKEKSKLFEYATDAVRAYFGPRPGQKQYVSCLFLDAHWDKKAGTIRGHAALGGGTDQFGLAIFGSQSMQSYPSHIEEVVPAFTDCTRTDTNYVANDCGEGGSNWEAANIGIGAHMHETGHLLGCPHQESGVMLRDYTRLNRTFTTREPYSTRTKQQGQRLCMPKDECGWHRLDTLRFRFHPCFQLPSDQPIAPDATVQVWAVEKGEVLVTAATGLAWIELYPEGDDVCHHWIEYCDQSSSAINAPRQITLTHSELKERLPDAKRKRKLKLKIFSCGNSEHTVEDFGKLGGKESVIKLPDGRPGFKASKLGHSQMQGTQPHELILGTAHRPPRLMKAVKVWHGNGIDGLEFVHEDGSSELFGKRGGRPSSFALDTKMAETVMGFNVRAGLWIDGIQILTSTGRRSEMYGNATGGSGHHLMPPRGYNLAGLYGTCGAWLDGFGLIITR